MAITTFSTSFLSNSVYPTPITCGVPDSVLNGISPRYIVTITAYSAYPNGRYLTINAYLQDKFKLDTGSEWSDLSQLFGGVDQVADDVVQLFTNRSLLSAATSRRKWIGSKPIKMGLKLVLEAVNDAYLEVVLPSMRLQQLALPSTGGNNGAGFFLIPPGPSPFDVGKFHVGGTTIEMNVGGFLDFSYSNCHGIVVDSVAVTYENRMGIDGPIGAMVELNISTYQMVTQEDLTKIYKMQSISTNSSTPPGLGISNLSSGAGGN